MTEQVSQIFLHEDEIVLYFSFNFSLSSSFKLEEKKCGERLRLTSHSLFLSLKFLPSLFLSLSSIFLQVEYILLLAPNSGAI